MWLSDADPTTGLSEGGADYFILVDAYLLGLGRAALYQCDGMVCSPVLPGRPAATSLRFSYASGARFTLDATELGSRHQARQCDTARRLRLRLLGRRVRPRTRIRPLARPLRLRTRGQHVLHVPRPLRAVTPDGTQRRARAVPATSGATVRRATGGDARRHGSGCDLRHGRVHGEDRKPCHSRAVARLRRQVRRVPVRPSSGGKGRQDQRDDCGHVRGKNGHPPVRAADSLNATSRQVSTSPLPFTSTSPYGSVTKSSRRSSQVERVIWIASGVPCDSMRLAMFTVSPQRS